jgi:hypothetical protein
MNWLGQTGLMSPDLTTYPGYRFPAEIISHPVWLYCESIRAAWGPDSWFILTVCPDMDLSVFQATPAVERGVTS